MNNYWFLGLVQNGQFVPLTAEHPVEGRFRLTSAASGGDQSPEDGAIPLTAYEGSAILVRGIDGPGWIHFAVVVEQAGQILTLVLSQVFGPATQPGDSGTPVEKT